MSELMSRRKMLAGAALGGLAATCAAAKSAHAQSRILGGDPPASTQPPTTHPDRLTTLESKPKFTFCLNTATLRGQGLPLEKLVELTAAAGYTGIEPWIDEIEAFVKAGGNAADLSKKIADLGLRVESAIGFSQWIVDDPDARKKGLEQAKRDMDLVRSIGGLRIAAPPAGATEPAQKLDLLVMAERYAALLQVGRNCGVVPQLEVWGFSSNLSRLGESTCVAVEAGHPDACLLPDVYHIYKGGSDFAGLKLLSSQAVHVFHMNDYPANPPREKIGDEHRVHPGLGVAPLKEILQILDGSGIRCVLSLELFNREYWKQAPEKTAKDGIQAMQASVQAAGLA